MYIEIWFFVSRADVADDWGKHKFFSIYGYGENELPIYFKNKIEHFTSHIKANFYCIKKLNVKVEL